MSKSNRAVRLVNLGEIAGMAGVGSSAVSNWRKRHPDFPVPADEREGGSQFRLDDIVQWLERHNKKFAVPSESAGQRLEKALWTFANEARGRSRSSPTSIFAAVLQAL